MKTTWPCCPACELDYESMDAFEGRRFDWHLETCNECGHTYQIRFTDDMEFETRPLTCERTRPMHFALPVDHSGQEL